MKLSPSWLVLLSASCSAFVPGPSSVPIFPPRYTTSHIATESSDVSLPDSPQINYSEEDKYKVRLLLLERTLSEAKERNQITVKEKCSLEAKLNQSRERELELQSRVNDLAKELHFLANELLDQSQTFSRRENILRGIITEGQRNLTRSNQQLTKYMVESEKLLLEKSDALGRLQVHSEEQQRQIDILSSRVKIMETVLRQSKSEARGLQEEITGLQEEVRSLLAEKANLQKLVDQLSREVQLMESNTSQSVGDEKTTPSAEAGGVKQDVKDDAVDLRVLKDSLVAELEDLRQFITDAKLEYRSLVTATVSLNNARIKAHESSQSDSQLRPIVSSRRSSSGTFIEFSKALRGFRDSRTHPHAESFDRFDASVKTPEGHLEKFLRIISIDEC